MQTDDTTAGVPQPRYEDSIAFLGALYPDGPWALASIDPEKRTGPCARTFGPSSEAECRAWIAEQNRDRGVYYHLNRPRTTLDKRAKKTDIAAVPFLHVDVDPRVGEALAEERARILRLLTASLPPGVPPPTHIIDSGGGYQALWALREPIALAADTATDAEKEAAAEEAERHTRAMEVAFGADNTHNVDRVLRLPGTINWPDKKKRAKGRAPAVASLVTSEPSRTYDAAQFRKAPPKVAPPSSASSVAAPSARHLASIDDLPPGVPGWCRVLIVQGGDPDHPDKWKDRSKLVLRVCCELLRCGVDDATIVGVITDDRFGVSAHVREKGGRNTAKYAQRQVDRAREHVAAEDAGFATDDKGRPFPTQGNIRIALGRLGVTVEHDDFSDRDYIRGLPGFGPHLDDKAMNRLRLQVDEQFRLSVGKEFFYDVVSDAALANRRHPVREYLAGLSWDGTPRLDTWLSAYASAEDSEYTRAVGALVLVAAVRRVRQPGCKFDEMLVLEGPQGKGKSSLLATLAVREDWFSDDLPLNADTKRQMEALAGRWIVEAGELKGMRKGDAEALKGFLSRRVDRARMAYGRAPTELPRQCIIIGTTNSDKYLKDSTGNRRFWPVRTGELRLSELARDRDHLWAEAAAREAAGAPIRLDPALYAAAADAQEDRLVGDPFMEILQPMLGEAVGKIATEDVWKILDRADRTRRSQDDASRLGEVMRRLGWERKYRRIGGEPQYVYLRGTPEERERAMAVEGQEGGWRVVELAPGRAAADQPRAAEEPEIPF